MNVCASGIAASPLTLRFFGPMQVLVDGRGLPPLRSRKALWVLALLVLHRERPVAREWLAEMLWPEMELSRGLTNLRVVLSELRRGLGEQKARLQTPDPHTLSFNLAGADSDLDVFDAALQSRHLEALQQAVALYRGPLLEGCTEEWVFQERLVREQHCLSALVWLGDAALEAGDSGLAEDYYRRAIGIDPTYEAARRGCMQALAHSGDRNAALQIYREFIQVLRSDPDAVPEDETRSLYTRLRAELRLAAPQVKRAIRESAPRSPEIIGSLPLPPTDLIGREEESFEVGVCLRQSRLVSLTGPGGIGKTRLAIEVARAVAPEYADGVWFVSLETLSDDSRLAQQIASVLGLQEIPARSWQQSITAHLHKKRLLLVLDNCEHLLEASAQMVAHLLRECEGVHILVTSREALGIQGEAAWTVPALAKPDPAHLPQEEVTLLQQLSGYESVQLFVERARAIQSAFVLAGNNARTVAQVCYQLEGIPLSIELAAAQVRSMTVEQIEAHLDDRLGLLTGEEHTARSRQQTLRATLDWSYGLLSEPERVLLHRLSIFVGGWTLEASEQVGVCKNIAGGQVLDLLTALVDKSLVVFEEREREGRYRLLEIVRQYSAERLQGSGEEDRVQLRHLEYFRSVAETAEPHLQGAEQQVWLQRLEKEHDNLRTALTREGKGPQEAETSLCLAGALGRFWLVRGHYREGQQFLELALRRAGAQANGGMRAKALSGAGALAYAQSDYDAAREFYAQSLALCQGIQNRPEIARILAAMSVMAIDRGDHSAAQALLEESLVVFRELGDKRGTARALANLGAVRNERSDYGAAQALYRESLEILEENGDKRTTGWVLSYLGITLGAQRDYAAARDCYERSLHLFEEIGDRKGMAAISSHLGNMAGNEGDHALAQQHLEESTRIYREMGERRALAWGLANLSSTLYEQSMHLQARSTADESLQIFLEIGDRRGEAIVRGVLGEIVSAEGDRAAAGTYFEESLRISRDLQDRLIVAMNLERVATILLATRQPHDAVRLWSAAADLREKINAPMPPNERKHYAPQIAQLRDAMGEAAFDDACQEGRTLSWEQAVSDALDEGGAN